MTKINIAKVLIITTMIFAKETLTAQWSGIGTSTYWTNTNVGVGISSTTAKVEINSVPTAAFGTTSGTTCSYIYPHLSISGNTFTKSLGGGPFGSGGCSAGSFLATITGSYNWDIFGGENGSNSLFFKLFKNGTFFKTPLTLLENSVSINNPLNVSGLITTNGINSTGNNTFNSSFTVNTSNFSVENSGNTIIGGLKATFHPDAKLHVAGKVAAQHFVITKPTNWSDKVFQKGYKLRSLNEIEQFINQNKHLPDVPSEAEVMEKGYDANEMDAILLQKIEELTLFSIEQNKKIAELQKQVLELKKH